MSANHDEILTYERLTLEQRAVAWAVVRSIATALWVGLTPMTFAWVVVAASQETLPLSSLPLLIGTTGLAIALEVKSRDLEKLAASPARS